MIRWLPLVAFVAFVALAACGHGKARGPAWPEPSTTAEDGGESIEPRPSAAYAGAIEKSADEEKEATPEATASDDKPEAETSEDKPVVTPASMQSATDDVLMTEEIIIEIEE